MSGWKFPFIQHFHLRLNIIIIVIIHNFFFVYLSSFYSIWMLLIFLYFVQQADSIGNKTTCIEFFFCSLFSACVSSLTFFTATTTKKTNQHWLLTFYGLNMDFYVKLNFRFLMCVCICVILCIHVCVTCEIKDLTSLSLPYLIHQDFREILLDRELLRVQLLSSPLEMTRQWAFGHYLVVPNLIYVIIISFFCVYLDVLIESTMRSKKVFIAGEKRKKKKRKFFRSQIER